MSLGNYPILSKLNPVLTGFLLLFLPPSEATDLGREQAYLQSMHDQQVKGLFNLTVNNQYFAAIFKDAIKNPQQKALIILHDQGDYPDQQSVVHTLRQQFPEHQWASLSLQMPLREAGALAEDYLELLPEAASRIQVALDYLGKQGFSNFVLVGYGMGATAAVYDVAEKNSAVNALVAISLGPIENQIPSMTDMLKKIKIPFLDMYAEHDRASVLDSARERRVAAKDNPDYRQLIMENQDHSYRQDPNLLFKRIYSWLSREVPLKAAPK